MFNKNKTGFIEDSFDPRDLWEDEILGGEEVEIPKEYRVEGLTYDKQGRWPFCAAFAATTLAEYKVKELTGVSHQFSQPHLFFHADGTINGSTFRNNLNVLKDNGAISYSKMPMPNLFNDPKKEIGELKDIVMDIPFDDSKKIGGYFRVATRERDIKRAIINHGPLLVGVDVNSTYYTGDAKRKFDRDNHAVLLVGWNENQWLLFDSLSWVSRRNGYGTINGSYVFRSVYAVNEMPSNWKEIRDEKRKEGFDVALNHYGQHRDLGLEMEVAAEMYIRFTNFKNKSVMDASGKFWPVYINAIAYGGYSYRDVINDCYQWRRTNLHAFNLNDYR